MNTYNVEKVIDVMRRKGYAVFTTGKYNLNLVGVRTDRNVTNAFDDTFLCFYRDGNAWVMHQWPCTTDPGRYWIQNGGMSPKGCAVYAPGQYRGAYQIGLHKGQYKALVQTGAPIKVFRDRNADNIYDYENPDVGFFGCNIHRSSLTGTSVQVDKWSAGCQVFANINDYNTFLALAEKSRAVYGNKFTYTLLERKDFDE